MKHFIEGDLVAVDTETTGLAAYHNDRPFAFSFCNKVGDTAYFEWPVDPMTRTVQPIRREWKQIKAFMEDDRIQKVFHNAFFDVLMLDVIGIGTAGPGGLVWEGGAFEETMFMAHVFCSDEVNYRLKRLSKYYVDYDDDDQKALQKIVNKCRRRAKKLAWKIAFNERGKAVTAADYWLPSALAQHHPELAEDLDLDACKTYAVGDVERTMLLYLFYAKHFGTSERKADAWKTYRREKELWPVTYRMQRRGVSIDRERNEREIKSAEREIAVWQPVVDAEAARQVRKCKRKGLDYPNPFNINSSNHLAWLVFDRMGLEAGDRTASERYKTTLDALYQHVDNEVVRSLLKYRSAFKALSTFYLNYRWKSVPDHITSGRGVYVLHPSFQQLGTKTARLACRDPNLQNVADAITTRSGAVEPIQARVVFGPRPGYVWYHMDYEQLEVRVFAEVSGEKSMLAALNTGRDIHTECANKAWGGECDTAIRMAIHSLELDGSGIEEHRIQGVSDAWKRMGIKPAHVNNGRLTRANIAHFAAAWLASYGCDIVTAEKSLGKKNSRAQAKMVLFLKMFGGGAHRLALFLKCPDAEAQDFLDGYDRAFPRLPIFQKEMIRRARRDGAIINKFGRRLVVDYDKAYRSVNYMVQGSAAELLKKALLLCDRYLRSTGLDAHPIMTIHDEIVFEFHRKRAYWSVLRRLHDIMSFDAKQDVFKILLPIDIEKCSTRWDVLKTIKLPEC